MIRIIWKANSAFESVISSWYNCNFENRPSSSKQVKAWSSKAQMSALLSWAVWHITLLPFDIKNKKSETRVTARVLSTGQRNNIAQPKPDKWFCFSSYFSLFLFKCHFVAWGLKICRLFVLFLFLINNILLNLLCVWI